MDGGVAVVWWFQTRSVSGGQLQIMGSSALGLCSFPYQGHSGQSGLIDGNVSHYRNPEQNSSIVRSTKMRITAVELTNRVDTGCINNEIPFGAAIS